jgi:hypothetical protein
MLLSADYCFGLNKMHMRFITLTVFFFRSSFISRHFLNGLARTRAYSTLLSWSNLGSK